MKSDESQDATASILQVRSLTVGFEETTIVRGVSFDLWPQETLVLMGPAGVGKSTLLRTLARCNDALPSFWTHGLAKYRGRDLLKEIPREEACRTVALLAQKARLCTASVSENIIAGVNRDEPWSLRRKLELAVSILESAGLYGRFGDRLRERVTTLSIAEQRMITTTRLLAGGAKCLLADEPLRDIPPQDVESLLAFLEQSFSQRPVILITHDQKIAQRLGDRVCLLSAGQIAEVSPVFDFFSRPQSALSRSFVSTGNCWPVSGTLGPLEEVDSLRAVSRSVEATDNIVQQHPSWHPTPEECRPRPGGFHWIRPGLLGGTQMPGLLKKVQDDLAALRELKVLHLVSLTEEPFEADRLSVYDIEGYHCPIVDMSIPTVAATLSLCQVTTRWLKQGEATVFHCRAGLGRTGTLLACMLVFQGANAVAAIEELRHVNRYYIQTQQQFDFVLEFEESLRSNVGVDDDY